MTRSWLRGLLAASLLVIAAAPDTLFANELEPRIDEYLSACEQVLHFNGAALVAHEGRVLTSRGIGLANFEHQVANTPQTRFRIGSITKSFTALLVLLEVQAGHLALDDPVGKHLQDVPPAWAPLTIHQLLTHTSGIFNVTDLLEYVTKRPVLGSPKKLLAMVRDKPLRFPPGEKHEYSNSGYLVLGLLLEKLGGKPYAELVRERICDPLEMRSTGFDFALPLVPHRAQGYSRGQNGKVENAVSVDMRGVHAAGALYSTVEDLVRYDAGLNAGRLLNPELTAQLYTPALNNYAYGWVIDSSHGRRLIWHNGGIEGFSANLTRCPETQTVVTVLSNFDDGLPDRVARELTSLVFGEEYRVPRVHAEQPLDPAALPGLVGRYELAPGAILEITVRDERLFAQLTQQPRIEIFSESADEFFYKVVDAQLTFQRDADGRATQVTLHQAGRHLRAPRLADEPSTAPTEKP